MKTASHYKPHPFWPKLGAEFFDPVKPAAFPKGILRYRNQEWAERLGLGEFSTADWKNAFWAFQALPGNIPEPMALRYHGHQFMHYNPDLGDGRGFLFAQLIDPQTGKNLDLATKGSGQTPWSRRGDGRLTLKGAMREALATGMLEALGVNTSKTFSIFETGEDLVRGDEPSPTRSAVLVRLSHSHIRIGTFQRLAFTKDVENLKKLLNFCLEHYYPEISQDDPQAVEKFFNAVCASVARTSAQWMLAGFVHGVLNTDNINITGESFDYGPYRFLPYYDHHFTAAYFDQSGLYAYGEQPRILMWNLNQLKECLDLIKPSAANLSSGFETYQDYFTEETFSMFLKRLNLAENQLEHTEELFLAWVKFMEKNKVPFEHFFFDWYGGREREDQALKSERKEFYQTPEFKIFFEALKKFTPANTEVLKDEYFSQGQPVHLYIEEIESIWSFIDKSDDWSVFENKLKDFAKIKKLLGN